VIVDSLLDGVSLGGLSYLNMHEIKCIIYDDDPKMTGFLFDYAFRNLSRCLKFNGRTSNADGKNKWSVEVWMDTTDNIDRDVNTFVTYIKSLGWYTFDVYLDDKLVKQYKESCNQESDKILELLIDNKLNN